MQKPVPCPELKLTGPCPGHALREWSKWYLEAMAQTKNPRIPFQMKALMDDAGFKDVVCDKLQLPMCGWTNGSRMYWLQRTAKSSILTVESRSQHGRNRCRELQEREPAA